MSRQTKATIWDRNVVAPEALSIPLNCRNERTIAAWYERLLLYTEVMRGLQRAVVLGYDPDDNKLYATSVEDAL